MVKIIWSDLAIDDLKNIHEYIAKDSKIYADNLIVKLISKIDQLESFPKSGRIVPEFNSDIIRELIDGNYRIIYRVSEYSVGKARIHHSAKQLTSI